MLNVFSTLHSAICAPINFATTQIGNLFSKIKSVVAPIFNSIGSFFHQRYVSLSGRVTVGDVQKSFLSTEKKELERLLNAWTPNCSAETANYIRTQIMESYNTTELQIGAVQDLDYLPDVFMLNGFANLKKIELRSNLAFSNFETEKSASSKAILPDSIGSLRALEILNLMHIDSLTSLPESLKNLTNLKELTIIGCQELTTLPEGMENLKSLKGLTIRSCPKLTTLPESLGTIRGLLNINLAGCGFKKREDLPESIRNLRSLSLIESF